VVSRRPLSGARPFARFLSTSLAGRPVRVRHVAPCAGVGAGLSSFIPSFGDLDMNRKRAFTLIELLVVLAIIAVLVGLLLPALQRAQTTAKAMKDGTQIKEIHRSFLTFANGNGGRLPIPGLINRGPSSNLNVPGPAPATGYGPEDPRQNTTQNLYSALIAQEYFAPDILIGPTEVNPIVVEDLDYDYARYAPADDSYWDDAFEANIWARPGQGFFCNTSYAHEAVCGDRKTLKWRTTQESSYPILGTRGVKKGVGAGVPDHDRSPTLLLHPPKRLWVGNICFADNHMEQIENFYPDQVTYEPVTGTGGPVKDNIYAAEFEHPVDPRAAADAWLVISIYASQDGMWVLEQYDALLP
jgi:prepilin-type N-terminal cleavage/methylation domain-containing protein